MVIKVKNIISLLLKLAPGSFFPLCLINLIILKIIVTIRNIGRTSAKGIYLRTNRDPPEATPIRTLSEKIRIRIISKI